MFNLRRESRGGIHTWSSRRFGIMLFLTFDQMSFSWDQTIDWYVVGVYIMCSSKLFGLVLVGLMVLNATFNNISVISWRSVLLVEETGVPGENHRSVGSH
jgi:hypothetical protein